MTSQQRTSHASESVSTAAIFDASGRYLAPPQTVVLVRPDGPWNQNGGSR